MATSTTCRYYTERTLGWMLNNKVVVTLSVLSFCLIISTWAMAAQRNRAYTKIDELNAELATTTTLAPVIPEEGNNTDTGDNNGNGGNSTETGGNENQNNGTGDNGNIEENPPEEGGNNGSEDENNPSEGKSQNKGAEGTVLQDNESETSKESDIKNVVANSKLLSLLEV